MGPMVRRVANQQTRLSQAGEPQNTSGYTLVELLVVLTIIALLLTAAPTMISAGRPSAAARSTTYLLADQLREARNAAILNNADYSLLLDLTKKTSVIVPGGLPRSIPSAVTIEMRGPSASPDSDVRLKFHPDGTSTGASILVSSGRQSHLIVAHGLTGRISIDE